MYDAEYIQSLLKTSPVFKGNSVHYNLDTSTILRFTSVKTLRENIPDSTLNDEDFVKNLLQLSQTEFTLIESYGITLPKHTYGTISNEDTLGIYCIIEKISGKNLFEIEISDIPFEQIESLVEALTKYLLEKYENFPSETIWTDISSKQFMYGYTQNNADNQVYLTDLDPFFFQPINKLYIDDASARLENFVNVCKSQLKQPQNSQLDIIYNRLPKRSKNHNLSERHPLTWRKFS